MNNHKVKGDNQKKGGIPPSSTQNEKSKEEKPPSNTNHQNGNIRFQMVGDSSQLFEAEDFQKIKVNELKIINPDLDKPSEPTSQEEYPNGNIKLEIIGDTLDLFKPEDFEKIEVKPLGDTERDMEQKSEVDYDLNNNKLEVEGEIVNKNETKSNEEKPNGTVECNLKTFENNENKVKLLNGTALSLMLAESKTNDCFVVMFYVPWCPFSARLAPHYNALPRAFKQLDIVAFDVSKSTGYNTKFGTNAVPMILIFQQKNVIAKFNHTQKNLSHLIEFVSKSTGIQFNISSTEIEQIPGDLEGPVPTVAIEKFDYGLLLSWSFIIFVLSKILFKKYNLFSQDRKSVV